MTIENFFRLLATAGLRCTLEQRHTKTIVFNEKMEVVQGPSVTEKKTIVVRMDQDSQRITSDIIKTQPIEERRSLVNDFIYAGTIDGTWRITEK